MKGFCERWFVLERGVLSYYRTKEEMQHTCRGTLVIRDARIETEPGNNFIIYTGGAKKNGQCFQLRAHSERERQEWITALELAKTQSSTLSRSNTLRSHKSAAATITTAGPAGAGPAGAGAGAVSSQSHAPHPETQPAVPYLSNDDESESDGEEEEEPDNSSTDPLSGILRLKLAAVQRLHDNLVGTLDTFSDRLMAPPLDGMTCVCVCCI